jgi:hypothetical protein
MRSNSNLKLQRRGRGDFDFEFGAHFSLHSAIMRQSFRIRESCDGAGSGRRARRSFADRVYDAPEQRLRSF